MGSTPDAFQGVYVFADLPVRPSTPDAYAPMFVFVPTFSGQSSPDAWAGAYVSVDSVPPSDKRTKMYEISGGVYADRGWKKWNPTGGTWDEVN